MVKLSKITIIASVASALLLSSGCKIGGDDKEASTAPAEIAAPTPTPTPAPTPLPTVSISGVSPSSGSIAGGTTVTINGAGFAGGVFTVTLDGIACASPVVVSDAALDCTVGASDVPKQGDVIVTRQEDGQLVTATNAWTYLQPQTAFTWTGANGNGMWNTAGNWAGGVVPSATSDVIFSGTWCSGSACNVKLNGTITVKSLKMRANYTGTITENDAMMNTSGVTIGSVATDEAFRIDGGTWAGYNGGGPFTRRVNGIARFTGGTMNFTNPFSFYGSLYVLGGTFNTSATLLYGTGVTNLKASVTLPHLQILNGAGGRTEIEGTINATDFLINSGAMGCAGSDNKVLGGTIISSGNVTVQNSCGGTTAVVMTGLNKTYYVGGLPAAPGGIMPGTLTVAPTAATTLSFNIPGGGYAVRIASGLNVNTGATMNLGGNPLNVGGDLAVQSGAVLDMGGGTLTVAGQTTNQGTITP